MSKLIDETECSFRLHHDPIIEDRGRDDRAYLVEVPTYRAARDLQSKLSAYDLYLEKVGVLSDSGATASFIEWRDNAEPSETGGEWEIIEEDEAVERGFITHEELGEEECA
jgi:hypothetical protein